MLKSVLVSVVTVSYQADNTIEHTIQSVLNQSFCDFEYIVKDGDSTDDTNQIVEKYKEKFKQRGIILKHIINKDSGIYNAMNEAIQYCNGEWIMFLNADDCLYSDSVLSDIFCKNNIGDDIDIIYGDTDFQDEDMHFLWQGDLSVVEDKCPYCHQSSFVRSHWMKKHPFDEAFKITADYDFIFKSYKKNAKFLYIPEVISSFKRGGASGKYLVKDRIEHRKVQLRYQNEKKSKTVSSKIRYLSTLCSACVQEICLKILPKNVVPKIRHYRKKKRMRVLK